MNGIPFENGEQFGQACKMSLLCTLLLWAGKSFDVTLISMNDMDDWADLR